MCELEAKELRHVLDFAKIDDRTREVVLASYRSNAPLSKEAKLRRWHDMTGHQEPPQMKRALQSLIDAKQKTPFKLKPSDVDAWVTQWCPVCAMCKSQKKRYLKKRRAPPSTYSNQLWCYDVNGPEYKPDRAGCRYHLNLVDD